MGGDQPPSRRSGHVNFWFGHQGYEYSRPRPLLADLSVRRPVAVDRPGAARRSGRRCGRKAAARWFFLVAISTVSIGLLFGDRALLRRAHSHLDHGILALVGRPPLGRGHLRSVRDRDRLGAVREDGAGARVGGDDRRCCWRRSSSLAAACSARSTTSISAGRRSR